MPASFVYSVWTSKAVSADDETPDAPLDWPPSVPGACLREFSAAAAAGANVVPVYSRLFSDHLTPVLAYRCLVKNDPAC